MTELAPTVERFVNAAALAPKLEGVRARLDQVEPALEVDRQLLRDLPLFLMRQDGLEVFVRSDA